MLMFLGAGSMSLTYEADLLFLIFRQAYSLSLLKQQGRTSLGLADLILNTAESF